MSAMHDPAVKPDATRHSTVRQRVCAAPSKQTDRGKPRWSEWLLIFWLLLAMSAKVNSDYLPYVDWLTTPLLIPYALQNRFLFRRLRIPASYFVLVMLAVMALTALTSALDVTSMLQVAKLSIILVVLYSLFLSVPSAARMAMQVAGFGAVLNALCLVLGRAGVPGLVEPYGDGRWTTVLNHVGALAFLGLLAFGQAVYASLHGAKGLWWHVTVSASCVWLVICDGSRTGALSLLLIFFYIAATTIAASPSSSRARLRLLVLVSVGLAVGTFASVASSNSEDSIGPLQGRVTRMFTDHQGGLQDTLQAADIARFEAMLAALNAISSHPLWGHGFQSTYVVIDGTVVLVHNAYLQVFADLGLFGCLAFVGVVCWWVPRLPRILSRIRLVSNVQDRGLLHGAIAALCAFTFTCLYHPLSVEITDWIRFIAPSAIVFHFMRTYPARASRIRGVRTGEIPA